MYQRPPAGSSLFDVLVAVGAPRLMVASQWPAFSVVTSRSRRSPRFRSKLKQPTWQMAADGRWSCGEAAGFLAAVGKDDVLLDLNGTSAAKVRPLRIAINSASCRCVGIAR
ncbi:unnamed protein product [Durusdinium trenchii]|uniref:Uncharacterized protein n=1 Tax=Durusdinium trenchii TaxID=1381693 RepID=A0ABP0P124_9DINO